jgi:hypothetical protein
MNYEIIYVNKDGEVVTVSTNSEQEKDDMVNILDNNNAMYTLEDNTQGGYVRIPA